MPDESARRTPRRTPRVVDVRGDANLKVGDQNATIWCGEHQPREERAPVAPARLL